MKRILYVNEDELQRLEGILASDDIGSIKVLGRLSYVFPDKTEAVIQISRGVVGADVSGGLWYDGCNVDVMEERNTLTGVYAFQYNDTEYIVEIKAKPMGLLRIGSAAEFQEDQCRDDLIIAEEQLTKALKQVEIARNNIGSATGDLGIVHTRKTVLEVIGLLGSAQSSHGKLIGAQEAIEAFSEA